MSNLTLDREVTNAKLLRDQHGNPVVRVDKVRFSYPFVGTPSDVTDDDGQIVIDPKTNLPKKNWRVVAMLSKQTHVAAKDLCRVAINELIDNAKKATPTVQVPSEFWFLQNGDKKEDVNMHGNWLVTAADGRTRPTVRNGRGELIIDTTLIDNLFYGGCWGHVLFKPWYFAGKAKNGKTYPKRVLATLVGVVFWKDDTPFGQGRIDDTEAWVGIPQGEGDGMSVDDDEL